MALSYIEELGRILDEKPKTETSENKEIDEVLTSENDDKVLSVKEETEV